MKVLALLTAVFTATIYTTKGQQLYSSFLQALPTGIPNQVQLYYHLSWKQQSIASGTCVTPFCLKIYRASNKTAQFFGRFTDFKWTCHQGCAGKDLVTDLSHLLFSEVNSYAGAMWEAGEETVIHTFKPSDDDNVVLRFEFSNVTHKEVIEDVKLDLRTRSDTKRPNVSPSVAVLPIYRVPLGCSTVINLFPYDGDGDFTTCRWNVSLTGAVLHKKLCKITVYVTAVNGYVPGKQYRGSVILQDYSSEAVQVTRNGKSLFTSGPFGSVPVMFTVHVGTALSNPNDCAKSPRFEPQSITEAMSYTAPSNYSSRFTALQANATILTVGHGGVIFNKITNSSATSETATWPITANDTGVYKTCVMIYSSDGVPGETRCDTVLAADTDECKKHDICTDKSCGQCKNYWHFHRCSYTCNDDSINIGLIAGAAAGSVILLVAIVTGICLYLRYVAKRKNKVTDLKDENKQQIINNKQ